jgi:hypothetical protein
VLVMLVTCSTVSAGLSARPGEVDFPTASPEYYAYGKSTSPGRAERPALTVEQVTNITSTTYTYMGLNNTYNAKALYYYYVNTDHRASSVPTYLTDAMTQF